MKPITQNDETFICDIQAPCFQMLNSEEIQLVKASKTQVYYRKGENLTKQGTYASYVLFVLSGLVIQYVEGNGAHNFNLRFIKPGEFIGLSAVFTKNTFSYSSVALTDCQVFLVEKAAIADIVQHNGMFGFNIIKRYSEQNANLYETLRKVMYKQMNGRLAESLLYIDGLKKEFTDIFQQLSRKDLADFAGISTESTVKLLKTFEKEGLLKLNEKDIILLNHSALLDISKKG